MGRKLRLPPRYHNPNTSEFPYPNIRSHSTNVRRRQCPNNVQRRARIQPELLRTSEEEAISGLVSSMEFDDEQPSIIVSRDTNDSEHPEIDSDEVCYP